MSASPLERCWQDLRACLLEGGAHEDQLGALRATFFCGCHAVVNVLTRQPGSAQALCRELQREMLATEDEVRRHAMH